MKKQLFLSILVISSLVLPACAGKKPLFTGLGNLHHKISTKSLQAQKLFDQGLAFLYAFNHDEAIRSFEAVASEDPSCAMAYWGIAFAHGPHINNPVVSESSAKAAWMALMKAELLSTQGTEREKDLIQALAHRYADPQPSDRSSLDAEFAKAMHVVWKKYSDDPDIGALYAEALMDLQPWDLWTANGKPKGRTPEILATIEKVLEIDSGHPLALHLYIHAVEGSPNPEKAVSAADRLRDRMPGLGHLVHMPSHIDVRLGHWQKSIVANGKAIEADRKYLKTASKPPNFYRIYMAHNRHMRSFSAMMTGQSEMALTEIRKMISEMPKEWLKENAFFADGFVSMPFEVLARFGKWDEILSEPEPAEHFPISRAIRHAMRGVAYAAKKRITDAEKEQMSFIAARKLVTKEAIFGNNAAHDILNVAEHMLAGELLVASKKTDEGLAELRKAVMYEDRLRYDEPPDWILPVRHALGANLIRAGKAEEAEQVYRDDLARLPHNGWSLVGLSRALEMQGNRKGSSLVAQQFKEVWKAADVELTSSCYCQPAP